jgi:hypothetical protein
VTARRTAGQNLAPGRGVACWSEVSRGGGPARAAKNNHEKMRKKTGAKAGWVVGRRAAARRFEAPRARPGFV